MSDSTDDRIRPSRRSGGGDADCSPLIAAHLAELPGPVLVVGAAPAVLVSALTEAGRDVTISSSTLADVAPGSTFGAAIVLDLAVTDVGQLATLAALLAPDGRLAVVGANDSEHDEPGAPAGSSVVARHLRAAGLPAQEWMKLYPDARMPTLLLSSSARVDHPDLDVRALVAGHTGAATEPAAQPEALQSAPGFLVVAGASPAPSDPVVVRFSGARRRARFLTRTRIEQAGAGLLVHRDRVHPSLPDRSGPLVHRTMDEPYLAGRTWSTVLDDIVADAGWTVDDVAAWFRRWAEELTRAAGSDQHLDGSFLDAIPRNLLVDGDRATFVDLEWVWTEPLERSTVVFRALLHSLSSMVAPAQPDPSVPSFLGDLILLVAEHAGEALGAEEMKRAWAFESNLQYLVTGAREAPDHLDTAPVVPTLAALDTINADRAAVIADQEDTIAALRADLERAARSAAVHRQARAEAEIVEYERELRERQLADREAELRARLQVAEDRAAAADAAWRSERRRADRATAKLEFVLTRASWRLTRPFRLVRHLVLKSLSWLPRFRRATAEADSPTGTTPLGGGAAARPRAASKGALRQDDVPASAPVVDLDFYRARYPDVAHLGDVELRSHFGRNAPREGRVGVSWLRTSLVLRGAVPDERETVLVFVDDPAPAEGSLPPEALIEGLSERYHVVTVVPAGSALADAITDESGTVVILDGTRAPATQEFRVLALDLSRAFSPTFAVVTTLAGHNLADGLERVGVPVVALVGEVPAPTSDDRWLRPFFAMVSEIVYPTELVATSMAEAFADSRGRGHTVVAPPGSPRPADEDQAGMPSLGVNDYVQVVEGLGRRSRLALDRQRTDAQTILAPDGFDVVHYTGGESADKREFFVLEYLRRVHAAAPLSRPHRGVFVRRPRPGFHPLVYAESAPDFPDDGRDPFAHFLDAGSPAGPWAKRVIVPPAEDLQVSTLVDLPSVLVHGHFHFPELLPQFLDLLAANQAPRSLVLTTGTDEAAGQLRAICDEHPAGSGAEVLVVPNRGRNLSALLSGPVAERMRDHDVVLHAHGKRSPHLGGKGDRWRDYLWSHLLGDTSSLGDQIVEEFARSPRLGLVAPEDRRLNDWDLNRDYADEVLRRLGRTMPLPTHFDFPLGAMFWARTAALRAFLDADLVIDDYPAEPLPTDGSPLHALERLIPLVAEHDGYEFAKTYLTHHQY